jgi:hypothetical protein
VVSARAGEAEVQGFIEHFGLDVERQPEAGPEDVRLDRHDLG